MTARTVVAPREVVAYVIREGTERGKGRYWRGGPYDAWNGERAIAERWHATYCPTEHATQVGGRVVAIVRREPRGWAKLVEEHAALTAKVARLTANHTDWLRLLADTRAALGVEAGGSLIDAANRLTARVAELAGYQEQCEMLETAQRARVAILAGIEADRDAWKARAEEAEAPAPARVLRDGEGGCEPLPVDKNGRVVSVGDQIECGSGGFYAVTGIYGAKVEAAGYAHGLLDPSIRNTRPAPALDAAAPLRCSSTSATGTRCAHGHGHVGAHHDGTAAWRDEPAKPQPFAGLYVYATGTGYVLTRRGCDLLDALARGRQ